MKKIRTIGTTLARLYPICVHNKRYDGWTVEYNRRMRLKVHHGIDGDTQCTNAMEKTQIVDTQT